MACQWQHSVMGLILVFCISPALVQAESIVFPPANIIQILGGTAALVCRIDFGLSPRTMTWTFNNTVVYSYLSGLEEFPFADTKKYSIERYKQTFTLTVENLNIKDGGKYTCTAFELQATANLIVLGKPVLITPVSIPVEGNIVQYKCEAYFGGPRTMEIAPENHPFLRLFIYDNVLESSYYNKTLDSGNIHKVLQVASIKVNASMNGKQLTCEVRTTSHEANFTDHFTLEVQYPVRNTRYSPKNNIYEVGSQISCSADGKPTPTFEWRNVADPGRPVKGRWLNITETMAEKNEWVCVASNSIGGNLFHESVNATFEVIHDSAAEVSPAYSNDGKVYMVLGLFVVLICLFGIIGYFYWKQKGNRRMYHFSGQVNPDMNDDYYEKSLEMMELATMQQNLLSPDTQQEIMELLEKDEEEKFQFNPQVFLTTILEASKLISTEHYLEIVKKLSEDWKTLEMKPKEEPLQRLLTLLNDKEDCNILFNHQDKTLELIKILTETSCVLSMSECLGFLISNAEYISDSNCTIQWTGEFIYTIKLLLEKGADPTWIPNADSPEVKRSDTYSAQYNFFGIIKKMIVKKNHIFHAFMDILPVYFYKCNKPEQVRGTILHALVEPDWVLFEDLQNEPLIQQYLAIISKVNEYDPYLVNQTDWNGNSPLQLFIKGMNVRENALKHVENIVQLLRPHYARLMKNFHNQTFLHFLAEAFPVFSKPPNSNTIESFLKIVTDISLEVDTTVQDENGFTSLHILVSKYNKHQSDFGDLFLKLVKKVTGLSDTNVKNKQGLTALHILAKKFPNEVCPSSVDQYLNALSHLAARSKIENQNMNGQTALHILTESYKTDNAFGAEVICKLFKVTAFKNFNVQDKQGYTVLHVLANKYPEEISESGIDTYLKVVDYFCMNCHTNIKDYSGQTPLHIIAKKYSINSPIHCQEMLLELLKTITTESNIDVQDNLGQTALHILASKYTEEVSQYGLNAFLQALKHLIQMSSVTIQDHEGLTVFHILADSYKVEHCQVLHDVIKLVKSKSTAFGKDSNRTPAILHVLLSKNPLQTFLEVVVQKEDRKLLKSITTLSQKIA